MSRMMRWICVLVLGMLASGGAWGQTVVEYIHTDALGSVVAVTDASGSVIERREYEPYGAQLTPAVQDGPGYTGHVQDAATGLVYMQQRYYDPGIGMMLSVDPVTAYEQPITSFCRYCYARNNPYIFTDPDGRNALTAFGGVIYETGQFMQGNGFDGQMVLGALKDGYNGEGDGFAAAALEDASAVGSLAGGVGLAKLVGSRVNAIRQTGERMAAGLARGATKDDVKGNVRQVVREGGERQMRRDFSRETRGLKTETRETGKGPVATTQMKDGSTASARTFSDGGRPTVQVNNPKTDVVTKVRYDP